jgi:hypothetical protein
MMKYTIPTFSEKFPLLESVDAAKNYLLKKYALDNKIKTSEIDEETKKKLLNNPKFLEVKDLTAKNPGYTPMFTRFRIEQGAHMEELQEIYDNLLKFKQNLKQDLTMNINDYEKVVPTEEDMRPGYEILGDDLRNIERKRKLKRFYNELTPAMKKIFSKATDKQIDELTEISNQLDVLPEKDGKTAWKEFAKGLKKYEDTRTYPEYKDPKVAFADIISDGTDFVEGWKQDESGLIKKLKGLGPMAGILYAKNGYIAMSARAPEAQRAICADTNWCIRTDSTFWSYGKGRIQINIMNSNIPVTDPLSLIGITVNPDGTIHTDATRPNSRLRDSRGNTFSTLEGALKGLDYPQDLIDSVMKRFKSECDIKLAIERFYREEGALTERKIIESLLMMTRGFLGGAMSEDDWNKISGTVAQIIFDVKNMKRSQFMDVFSDAGIFSEAALNVFDRLIGDDYTKEQMEKIIKVTEERLQDMEYILELFKEKKIPADQKSIDSITSALDSKDEILKRLKNKLK